MGGQAGENERQESNILRAETPCWENESSIGIEEGGYAAKRAEEVNSGNFSDGWA